MTLSSHEYELTAIRSSGPGGQHANKVASAIQLRFDIGASSLSERHKQQLLRYADQRISQDGIILIKVDTHRSQTRNREEAVERLLSLIRQATRKRKKRKPTKPTRASKEKRLKAKKRKGQLKKNRGQIRPEE